MIQFLKVLSIVLIKQILFITSFFLAIYISNNNNNGASFFIPIILLTLYLISHFEHLNILCEKLKLDKESYKIYGFISWILVEIILLKILFNTGIWNLLPKTNGMFSGIEYIFIPILLSAYLVILCILELIIFIINIIIDKVAKK